MTDSDRPQRPDASEDRLDDYIEGRLDAGERARLEEEILRDDALARALYSRVGLRAVLGRSVPSERTRGGSGRVVASDRRRWLARVALPLAAGLALAILAPRILGPLLDGEGPVRGDGARPVGLSPKGALASSPTRFVWTRAHAAAKYRFELYDDSAHVLFQATTGDTTLAIPDGAIEWTSARAATWRVVALTAVGVELSTSKPLAFSF
jgi:hypothetical protein